MNFRSHYYLWTRYAVISLDPSVFRKLQTFFSARIFGNVNILLCASKFTFWLDGQNAQEHEIRYSHQIQRNSDVGKEKPEKRHVEKGREEKSSGGVKEIKLFLNKTGEFMTFCGSRIPCT